MKTIEQMYISKCNEPSDINEHLPTLFQLSKECKRITEFGVRGVVSTWAFAHARPQKLICVDIIKQPEVDEFLNICKAENQHAEFLLNDTLKMSIDETDLLFIDTLHTYDQLLEELTIHHSKATKYIIMHDTISHGYVNGAGHTCKKNGLIPAIQDFLSVQLDWKEKYTYKNNNGITVLERKL